MRRRRTFRASRRPTRASASGCSATKTTASSTSSRCAATCPRASPRPANSATPTNWWISSAREFGDTFLIEVAAYPEYHPQAKSAQDDLLDFKRKVEAGADSAITQYFYNADAYYRFVDDCEAMGISIPIVPGIMPIGRFSQLARFSDACGAEIPRWMRKKLEGYGDDTESIRAFGLDVVTALCDDLLKQRRAGPALLHAEPGGADHHHLAAAGSSEMRARKLERRRHRRERPLRGGRGQPVFSRRRGEARIPARQQHAYRVRLERHGELLSTSSSTARPTRTPPGITPNPSLQPATSRAISPSGRA